ncbi:MAG: hypothetical protein WEB88_02365 [Gemmatimonadota bacterium]
MMSLPRMRATVPLVGGFLLLAAAVAGPAQAQESSRWTFTAIAGTTDRGPAEDIHADFQSLEYVYNSRCIEYPCPGEMTETGFGASGYPFLLEFRFAVTPWAGVGVLGGKTEIGRTHGYDPDGAYLRLRYEADIMAPMVWFSARDIVRVAAGPARYTARVTREDYARLSEDFTESVWGPVYEGSLSLPIRGAVRFEARAQRRLVGEVEYGPYLRSALFPSEIFPATKADFSHWFFGAGFVVGL